METFSISLLCGLERFRPHKAGCLLRGCALRDVAGDVWVGSANSASSQINSCQRIGETLTAIGFSFVSWTNSKIDYHD